MRGGFGHDLDRGALEVQRHEAHGVERLQGGLQRHGEASAPERFLQRAAQDQR